MRPNPQVFASHFVTEESRTPRADASDVVWVLWETSGVVHSGDGAPCQAGKDLRRLPKEAETKDIVVWTVEVAIPAHCSLRVPDKPHTRESRGYPFGQGLLSS